MAYVCGLLHHFVLWKNKVHSSWSNKRTEQNFGIIFNCLIIVYSNFQIPPSVSVLTASAKFENSFITAVRILSDDLKMVSISVTLYSVDQFGIYCE